MNNEDTRPSWDAYFMKLATDVATRATCPRKHVGAVIVRDKRILSTGYNGSPRGMPHCTDVGCELKNMGGRDSCVRTIHAEANAIAQAAQNGVSVEGATIYTTASPCYDCTKLILNAGIKKVVYGEFYNGRYGMSDDMVKFLAAGGASAVCCSLLQDDAPSISAVPMTKKIKINGYDYEVIKKVLTYKEIADIVYGLDRGLERSPTIIYKKSDVTGTISRGDEIEVTDGLYLKCVVTGSA